MAFDKMDWHAVTFPVSYTHLDVYKRQDITVYELGGVKSNPRLELVYEGIAMCRSNGIGFVLAVGGGSVIDSAKAIACGTPNSDDVWDYFLEEKTAKAILPIGTILTIPGAGSESSDGMVTVSYTHLDVYKRQMLYQKAFPNKTVRAAAGGFIIVGLTYLVGSNLYNGDSLPLIGTAVALSLIHILYAR